MPTADAERSQLELARYRYDFRASFFHRTSTILPVTGAIAAAHGDVASGVLTADVDDNGFALAVGLT